jgi:hypothetical protein
VYTVYSSSVNQRNGRSYIEYENRKIFRDNGGRLPYSVHYSTFIFVATFYFFYTREPIRQKKGEIQFDTGQIITKLIFQCVHFEKNINTAIAF